MWAADNLAPLDMPYLSIAQYNNPNKSENHTSTFVYCLLVVKIEFHFYLEKNWYGQNQSSQTISTGPVLYTFVKIEFYFYLCKNWSGQNWINRTVSADPVHISLNMKSS